MQQQNLDRYKNIPPIPESVWKNPLHFIAFGFGSGALPVAPGTFGTLMAIPFYLIFSQLSWPFYLVITVILSIICMWICQKVAKDIGVHDHQGMCLDEFPGFFVTMIHAPHGIWWIVSGFLLFRLFDIWKPWPIRWADQHVTGGFGMVFDDILAGVYAYILMQILARIF